MINCLSATPHRYIVSKGPLHDEIELAANMAGAEFLPQTSILPICDLVITHGGNNTVTECLHFGKPMIVLPLFWDQYDNAQRIQELGLGVRLNTYQFTDAELHDALNRLLTDARLRSRLDRRGGHDPAARRRSAGRRPHRANGSEIVERPERLPAPGPSRFNEGARFRRLRVLALACW